MTVPEKDSLLQARETRAAIIANSGSLHKARRQNVLSQKVDLSLSEALIIGLIEQDVRTFYTVLGHGSTDIGEVLRVYQNAGIIKVFGLRNEIEASHSAAALRWVTGEKSAVVTSIGPGALQALSASIVPASDGIGVWYIFGDETTQDEGYNMQQIPMHGQGSFVKMMSVMGRAYSLHTPEALSAALRAGAGTVDHPFRPGPFYLLMPMNTQAACLHGYNLDEIPDNTTVQIGKADGDYESAVQKILSSKKLLVKVGGGSIHAGKELIKLLDLTGGVLVHTPIATGCIPYSHPANMGVGGSKGSLCGNYAMENADVLIAIGTRAVCQSDCSRTGYPNVKNVININPDLEDALHYNQTTALLGDACKTLQELNRLLQQAGRHFETSNWLAECTEQKTKWQYFKQERRLNPVLMDEYWQKEVLTQPAVILTALNWAKRNKVITFFDAGDVQANGFQIVEDEEPGKTFTESGASYMGFAVSALLSSGTSSLPFYALALTGDGSFTMNPQILIDGVEHGAKGCILLLDNGRMGAISSLQKAQYGNEFATSNSIHVDYVAWAKAVPGVMALNGGCSLESLESALESARKYNGLSLIHVPVYFGPNELGGMGVYGRWNVGNWCTETQRLRHEYGL